MGMAYQTFQQEYMQIPPVTRAYTTACVLTTLAVTVDFISGTFVSPFFREQQLDIISPFQLYFNPILIWKHFQAPYLPWVLLAFSILLGNSVTVDLLGMTVGHIYYFVEDVFPLMPNGTHLLKTPHILYIS
ncbi:unnamed protein product [Darwinula stevensoni]|uniref:Derlin n=1 Tax=Darwinula stevensoni TaxID=69355 RepID=A0A7R9A0D9_9CRUS|nr:unnamed protein product [Darwinula stevensoni]CAG0884423.1 unnamed protein product [Darwinula stevensoni]